MKKQYSTPKIVVGISLWVFTAFTVMAFQDPAANTKKAQTAGVDTIPKNHTTEIEINLEDINQTIRKSMEAVEKSIKSIEWNKIAQEVDQSLRQVDLAKMQLGNSLKKADWDKIKQEIDRSMNLIDMNKMRIDMEKMKTDINHSLKEITIEALRKSVEEMKKINFDELKRGMESVKKEIELNKDHLKIEMGKLTAEMAEVKEMTGGMEKDGLINKKESNTVEYKDKQLLINGKKQSQQVSDKYSKYFKGDHFKFIFNGEDLH